MFVYSLGLIANRHLAFADQLEEGAKHNKCLQLARMHRYVKLKIYNAYFDDVKTKTNLKYE